MIFYCLHTVLGHLLVFGDMDECLSVKKLNNVTGQLESAANYCLTRLSHPAMVGKLPALPAYGACLPHSCANRHDANAFVTDLFRVMKRAADLEAVQVTSKTSIAALGSSAELELGT